jgi:hypothetical protein
MSASSIVSLGFGSWGSIGLVTTLGYSGAAAEHDYDVDECTVFASQDRGERMSSSRRGDRLSSIVRGGILSTDRSDLFTSADRGDLFDRRCD